MKGHGRYSFNTLCIPCSTLLEHRIRSNEKDKCSDSTYHNNRKEGSNSTIRKEGSKDRTSNVENATQGDSLFPTRISVDGKANLEKLLMKIRSGCLQVA